MPFDAELTLHTAAAPTPAQRLADRLMGALPDPDLAWATADPGRLVAYLYISPRPCLALDALLFDEG